MGNCIVKWAKLGRVGDRPLPAPTPPQSHKNSAISTTYHHRTTQSNGGQPGWHRLIPDPISRIDRRMLESVSYYARGGIDGQKRDDKKWPTSDDISY
jgi:hypothetical protein